MAIRVYTQQPKQLLQKIKTLIDEGRVQNWSYDNVGDFTHCVDQLANMAWLHPEIAEGSLRLKIVRHKIHGLPRAVYSVYHGRFIEMLMAHFSASFTAALCWTEESVTDEPEAR
jgi:hypothetical protein